MKLSQKELLKRKPGPVVGFLAGEEERVKRV